MTNYCPECGARMVEIVYGEIRWNPWRREKVAVDVPHPLEYAKVVSRHV